MVLLGEPPSRVVGEVSRTAGRHIRRVKVAQIAGLSRLQEVEEVPATDVHVPKQPARLNDALSVDDGGVLVPAEGHVELALGVHSVEAVVPGLVQVEEQGGVLDGVCWAGVEPAPEPVILFLVVPVDIGYLDELLRAVPDYLVEVHETRIDIVDAAPHGFQAEEYGAASHERLMVRTFLMIVREKT